MSCQKTLFTQVERFYLDLLETLESAEHAISMMYYAFDHGVWAEKIARVLAAKARSGLRVRLMVDQYGQVLDEPRHALKNRFLLEGLEAAGVQVDLFKPAGHELSNVNRLHCKICAIDLGTVFLGGSNIGDHYPTWEDHNLRLDGPLGDQYHQLYDLVRQFSDRCEMDEEPDLIPAGHRCADGEVYLTVPGKRTDIREALLKLIREADQFIYIRTWYFLPDPEIQEALRAKAEKGVEVNVLLSHKTRVRPIDFANYIHCHKLAKAGGRIFRFAERFMHAKVAWNNHGDVLFGSANLENMALHNTFECCVKLRDQALATRLRRAFESDARISIRQTPALFRRRPVQKKALSYACNLASAWL